MQHVVTQPAAPLPVAGGALRVHMVPAAKDNLSWVLEADGRALVVDGPDAAPVLAYCEAQGLEIVGVLNTHTHWDHIGINEGLPAGLRIVGPARAAADVPGLTEPVDDGAEVSFGDVVGRVLLTEGHIDGHVCYLFGDALFSGDTLFTGGCGRLFDGPPEKMFRSLLRLAELPGDTKVFCGHEYTEDNLAFARSVEPENEALLARIERVRAIRSQGAAAVPSTLEEERATNPFLRPGSPTLAAQVAEAIGHDLATPLDIFTATRTLKDRGHHRR